MLAAMESRMSGGCQRNFGESSEEELPVLPRHAKVIVTGNDKTKSVFVGIQGLVKKAVDLGVSGSIQLHKTQSSRSRHQKGSWSRSNSFDSQSKGSVSSSTMSAKVDLSKLETTALQRYYRHFNLMDANPNPSKEQLIEVVQRHFVSQQLDEMQVITGFMQAAKRLKTICN